MTDLQTLREMVRYGAKGGSTMVANIGLMSLLVELGGVPPELASICSTTVMTAVGYLLLHVWVFPSSSPESHAKRGLTYWAVIMSGKALNWLLFVALLAVVPYPVAWVFGAGVVFLLLFSANRRLFKDGVAV